MEELIMDAQRKEMISQELIVALYREKYLQTLWNAEKEQNKLKGWRLKNFNWSPWFFNMRPIGSSPELFFKICNAMADLISDYNIDMLVAVEMAGIPLVGGTAISSLVQFKKPMQFGYTRPLPEKVRTPKEAAQLLQKIESDVAGYGQKEYVEGRLGDGMSVGIFDDMANNLGSKIIARQITLWTAMLKDISVKCNNIFYFLDRSKGNIDIATAFADEKDPRLYPAQLSIDYIIEFDDYLPILQSIMSEDEYKVITEYQNNSSQFQDPDVQKEVLAMVK